MADISIIIRTQNSGKTLTKCLKEVRNQVLPPPLTSETIVVDHESTDQTMEVALRYAKKVFSFTELRPVGEYTPGAALNAGIREAEGNLIVLLSSHCFPDHKGSITEFIQAATQYTQLMASQGVEAGLAGLYGRQVPGKNLTDLEAVQLRAVFGNEWQGQGHSAKFYNGYSCLLKSAWEKFPFDESLTTMEDWAWAKTVLDVGAKLLYVPTASVVRMRGFFHPDRAAEARAVIEGTEPKETT